MAVGCRGRKARAPVCLQWPSRGEVYLLAREALHRDAGVGGLFGCYGAAEEESFGVCGGGCAQSLLGLRYGVGVEHCGGGVGSCAVGPECRDAVGLGVGHGQAEALVPFIFGVGAEARAVEEEYAAYVLYGACCGGVGVDPLLDYVLPLPLGRSAAHGVGEAVVEGLGGAVGEFVGGFDDLGGVDHTQQLAVERGLDYEGYVEPLALFEPVDHLCDWVLFEVAVV